MNNIHKLMQAAKSGSNEEVMQCLSQTHCDPLARDDYGSSALMWASHHGQEDCRKLLLSVRDVLARDNGGRSALMLASAGGHEACVRFLLPHSDLLNGHMHVAEVIDAYMRGSKRSVAPQGPRPRSVDAWKKHDAAVTLLVHLR